MARPTKLTVRWHKRQRDFWFRYPDRADAHLLHHVFCMKQMGINRERTKENPFPWTFSPSLIDELDARGYDTTTLTFTIEKKKV